MSTPHISAPDGAFAPSVLLPGDPLRARWIATELLSDASEVTEVRGILGYTGSWRGRRVSVMGTGMGVPSMNIYATELARHYGVARLVRIGSCGAIDDRVGLRDLIVVSGASTDSSVNRRLVAGHDFAATPDFALTRALVERAETSPANASPEGGSTSITHVGRVFTSDTFYGQPASGSTSCVPVATWPWKWRLPGCLVWRRAKVWPQRHCSPCRTISTATPT